MKKLIIGIFILLIVLTIDGTALLASQNTGDEANNVDVTIINENLDHDEYANYLNSLYNEFNIPVNYSNMKKLINDLVAGYVPDFMNESKNPVRVIRNINDETQEYSLAELYEDGTISTYIINGGSCYTSGMDTYCNSRKVYHRSTIFEAQFGSHYSMIFDRHGTITPYGSAFVGSKVPGWTITNLKYELNKSVGNPAYAQLKWNANYRNSKYPNYLRLNVTDRSANITHRMQ